MPSDPRVSIIVVSYNTKDLLVRALAPFSVCPDYEIIVVDNASADRSAEAAATAFPEATVVRSPSNLGFARANNAAFRLARGKYFLLLNPDASAGVREVEACVTALEADPRAAVAGPALLDAAGSPQPSARPFPSLLNELRELRRGPEAGDRSGVVEADWVPGAFFLVRASALREVGPFDEDFFMYYEEVDLCLRMRRAGYRVLCVADAKVRHIGGASAKKVGGAMTGVGAQLSVWRARSRLLFHRKNGGMLGAWGARLLEETWHTLRLWRNSARKGAEAADKAAEASRALSALRAAWADTEGGLSAPAAPW